MKAETLPRLHRLRPISCGLHKETARPARGGINHVLLPTDFSPASLQAIERVRPWLRRLGAEIHIVHIIPRDYPSSERPDVPEMVPGVEAVDRVRQHLRKVAEQGAVSLLPRNAHVLVGEPADEICRLARRKKINLIILTTGRHSGLQQVALGSTAERVVRFSPCPVMTLRGTNDRGDMKPDRPLALRKILVPVDFSECSRKGIEYATALAKQFGGTLTLLHSVHFQNFVTSDEFVRYDLPLLAQDTDKAAHEQMARLIRETDWDGVPVDSKLDLGHAGHQICAFARHEGADLIVACTHGMTGFKNVSLGSTTDYVVRHAECPVLIVPSHPRPCLGKRTSGRKPLKPQPMEEPQEIAAE